jgi:cytoskeletal protein RodZ
MQGTQTPICNMLMWEQPPRLSSRAQLEGPPVKAGRLEHHPLPTRGNVLPPRKSGVRVRVRLSCLACGPEHRPAGAAVGAFGDKLRQQREQRGLSLDAISSVTKISTRMLSAIENERFDQLPGGVFNKGFVRAYARQIGLNEEEVITDYLAALRESQIQAQAILPNLRAPAIRPEAIPPDPRNPERDPHARGNGHTFDQSYTTPPAIAFPANNVAPADRRPHLEDRRKEPRRHGDRDPIPQPPPVADNFSPARSEHDLSGHDFSSPAHPHESLDEVIPPRSPSFLNLGSAPPPPHADSERIPNTQPIPADHSTSRVAWEKLAAALLLITLALALWTLHRHRESTAAPQPAPFQPTPSQPAASQPSAAPVAAPNRPSPSTASPKATPSPKAPSSIANSAPANSAPPDPDTDVVVTKPPAPPAVAKAPPKFTLLIRADQTSWVAISADGQPVAKETLIAPANTSVRASREITVRAGNSAGISFLLNGKEVSAPGNPGEARTYTFDASGLQTSSTVPNSSTR